MASDVARFLHMFVGRLCSTSSSQNSLLVSFAYLLSRLFDFLVFGYFFSSLYILAQILILSDLSLEKISTNAGKDMEKIELLYMTDGNLN